MTEPPRPDWAQHFLQFGLMDPHQRLVIATFKEEFGFLP